jgi:hypothetical protein
MPKPAFLASELKVNFKLRDFFLDLMACIVPGLIFLVAVSIIVGGLFMISSKEVMTLITGILNMEFEQGKTTTWIYLLDSFSFNFWLFLLVTFLAYFTGHLLYRQSPKRPDYASFLRIRDRVIKKNAGAWVIEKGRGVKSSEVQFPYANLKNYLKERGFDYLVEYVDWPNESEKKAQSEKKITDNCEKIISQRSKTIINRAKIRLAFFFPEHMINLIRNEAHIRLASSMWYAAKYTIELSYICLYVVLLDLNIQLFFDHTVSLKILGLSLGLLLCCLVGKRSKSRAVRIMRDFNPQAPPEEVKRRFRRFSERAGPKKITAFLRRLRSAKLEAADKAETDGAEGLEEMRARSAAKRIDFRWQVHDHMPLLVFGSLFVFHYYKLFDTARRPFSILYLGVVTFILIGALFAKRYIEQTIHYQRVRELVYVLETAHVAQVLGKKQLPDPLEIEKVSYDIGLVFKESLPQRLS